MLDVTTAERPGMMLDDVRTSPALAVNRLTKRFGDRVAFRDVSFEVGHGGAPAVARHLVRGPRRLRRRHPALRAAAGGGRIVAPMLDRERLITGTGS
jgi:hypothetical protein